MKNPTFASKPPSNFTTDLACERKKANTKLSGVEETEANYPHTHLHQIRITSQEGADSLGKPKGTYVTLSHGPAFSLWGEVRKELSENLEHALRSLAQPFLQNKEKKALSLLVAGLGNRRLTADAIGPRCADAVNATYHLRTMARDLFEKMDCAGICVLSPGVLAQTGVEASSLVCTTAKDIKADLVIAIDALAAHSVTRLARTIQLCDTGVSPGGGIGNHRTPITKETVGAPVIAIGVPTVVHSTTLISDAFERSGADALPDDLLSKLKQDGFFVSPKDIDQTTDTLAHIIAEVINRTWGVVQ